MHSGGHRKPCGADRCLRTGGTTGWGLDFGPVEYTALAELAASGQLSAEDEIRQEDHAWKRAGEVVGLIGDPLYQPFAKTPLLPAGALPVEWQENGANP